MRSPVPIPCIAVVLFSLVNGHVRAKSALSSFALGPVQNAGSFGFLLIDVPRCSQRVAEEPNYDRKRRKGRQRSAVVKISPSNRHVHLLRALPAETEPSEGKDNDNRAAAVSIEYCTGCRWMLRAAWLAQELLTTFPEEVGAVSLVPSKPPSPAGTFLVALNGDAIWDRKGEGRFPEAKELKQRVRDVVSPSRDLGHSDVVAKEGKKPVAPAQNEKVNACEECNEESVGRNEAEIDSNTIQSVEASPNVRIVYCTGCRWMLRAAWYAQELLTTFQDDIHSVTLAPSRPPEPGGKFSVELDGKLIWDRKGEGRFPEAKELKQRVRDVVSPSRDLGHSDVAKSSEKTTGETSEPVVEDIDDDEAANMRQYFGVM